MVTLDESTASFLDKTDWRLTLHRKLESCVNAEGTEFYPQRVKSLISAASAPYPGWDAHQEIQNKILMVEKQYTLYWYKWLLNNTGSKWTNKRRMMKTLYLKAHKEMFEYIKCRCAQKRMLLWGVKRIGGGTQIPFTDNEEEE